MNGLLEASTSEEPNTANGLTASPLLRGFYRIVYPAETEDFGGRFVLPSDDRRVNTKGFSDEIQDSEEEPRGIHVCHYCARRYNGADARG